MRTYLLLFILLSASCRKDPAPPGQLEHIVSPRQTDAAITTYTQPHYAYVNPSRPQRNKLLLFLPGTGAEPKNYRRILQHAANLGYHAIGLMYPNEPAINLLCAGSGDVSSHSRARLEIIDGMDRHPGIAVNAANSIIQRFVKLIIHLQRQYPGENWDQYIAGGAPVWEKLLFAGHSQGAGHAGVMGKQYAAHRVILFSGMDYLSDGQVPDWVDNTLRKERYFALHHEQDELLDIAMVKRGWLSLGMGAAVDAAGQYNGAQAISTGFAPALVLPGRYHNATAVDVYLPANGRLDAAWDYLLQ